MLSSKNTFLHKIELLDLQSFVLYDCFAWRMSPEAALQEQIQIYRRMTGEQRLAVALELHELACNVAREGIRSQHPDADDVEVERLLHQRLRLLTQ